MLTFIVTLIEQTDYENSQTDEDSPKLLEITLLFSDIKPEDRLARAHPKWRLPCIDWSLGDKRELFYTSHDFESSIKLHL